MDPRPAGAGAPIFVVGVPRSGTTLLAAMLGAHPDIDCGPETHLLAHLVRADRARILDPRTWPDPATEFVLSLALQQTRVHEAFGVDAATVRASLAGRAPSVAALMESLTATRAAAHGKPRWAEKTPRHVAALPLIRREWPDAKVIRIVRDPRDVALSLSDVPFGSTSVVADLVSVEIQTRRADLLVEQDPLTLTARYEDLVTDPEPVLRRVCAAIDVPYDPAMLERRGAEALAAPHEWWKTKAAQPLDPSRVGRWRMAMDPATQRFAAIHLRRALREHGYDGAVDPRITVAVSPQVAQFPSPAAPMLQALAAHEVGFVDPPPRTPRELATAKVLVFWGQPGQIGVQAGDSAGARAVGMTVLAGSLAARRAAGRPAMWVRGKTSLPSRPDHPVERLTAALLRLLAVPVKPAHLPHRLGRTLGIDVGPPGVDAAGDEEATQHGAGGTGTPTE